MVYNSLICACSSVAVASINKDALQFFRYWIGVKCCMIVAEASINKDALQFVFSVVASSCTVAEASINKDALQSATAWFSKCQIV